MKGGRMWRSGNAIFQSSFHDRRRWEAIVCNQYQQHPVPLLGQKLALALVRPILPNSLLSITQPRQSQRTDYSESAGGNKMCPF